MIVYTGTLILFSTYSLSIRDSAILDPRYGAGIGCHFYLFYFLNLFLVSHTEGERARITTHAICILVPKTRRRVIPLPGTFLLSSRQSLGVSVVGCYITNLR